MFQDKCLKVEGIRAEFLNSKSKRNVRYITGDYGCDTLASDFWTDQAVRVY